jgi:hypothetical protein
MWVYTIPTKMDERLTSVNVCHVNKGDGTFHSRTFVRLRAVSPAERSITETSRAM